MNPVKQRSQDKAQELINLANDVIAHFNGAPRLFIYPDPYQNPKFKEIKKLERKFNKRYKLADRVDVSEYLDEFSIELAHVPDNLHFLMEIIGWIDHDTYMPAPHLDGFYTNTYYNITAGDRSTVTWHYITVKRYIDLLLIDNNFRDIYARQYIAA